MTTNLNSNGKGKLSIMIGSTPILVDILPNTPWVILNLICSLLEAASPYSIGHSWESKGNPEKSKLQVKVSWNISVASRFWFLTDFGKTKLPDESSRPYHGVCLKTISRSKAMTGCQIKSDSSSVRPKSLKKICGFSNKYLYELKKFEAYTSEILVKAIPGSSHAVHNSICALIKFLFSSISMRFLNIRFVSTITGKGLKYPFSPVKHIFELWLSSLQLFKSEIFNLALQGFKMQNTRRRYSNAKNIVKYQFNQLR